MTDSDSGRESPVTNYRTKVAYRHPKLIDEDRNTKLHYLAAANDVDGVKVYLRSESQVVDPQNYMGWTPLMMACRKGHFEAVKCLLMHRANVTLLNDFGMNAFQMSVASGNLEMAKYVLDHFLCGGISKRFLENSFSTVATAVLYKHNNILEFLIDNHFPINSATSETRVTPLMIAHAMEFNEAISILMKHEADTTTTNYIGHTASDITAIRQNLRSLTHSEEHRIKAQKAAASKVNQAENLKTEMINQQLRSMLQVKTENNDNPSPTSFYPQIPYIVFSSMPNTPINYLAVPNHFYPNQRNSSNVSPLLMSAIPNISPIAPLTQQMFFPPNFSPAHPQVAQHFNNSMTSSHQPLNQSDFLNARLNGSPSVFMSPTVFNMMSPCI